MTVQFWFEFGSTYSYPAAMRIEALASAQQIPITWRPFLLGPIFQAQGWNDSPFNLYPAKGKYMWRDLERICLAAGLRFQHPSEFPRNGLLATRVACRFAHESWLPDFVRAIFTANFADNRDISNPDVVASCLSAVGQSPEPVIAEATTAPAKAALRIQTEEAAQLGIFGAPSFLVDDELFWGNDRLEQALAWHAS